MALSFDLDVYQSRAFRLVRPGYVVTLPWGRGSGKTFLARALIHTGALSSPGENIGLILPSLKQARQIFWPSLLADFEGPLRGALNGPPNRTLLEATYTNGARLTTWGTENAGSIRGQRFKRILQDETDLIDPSTEHAIITPTFSRAGINAEHIKFGTPLRGRYGSLHDTFALAEQGVEGYAGFKLKSEDSPQVDQKWLERIRLTTPPEIFRREYECDFDSGEGRVYDLFEQAFHVREPDPRAHWSEIVVGVDWGYAHPGAMIVFGILGKGEDAQCHIIREYYERGKVLDWWLDCGREIRKDFQSARFFCDPSRPSDIEALNRAVGKVEKGDNKVEQGVSRVATMLLRQGAPPDEWARLYVSPNCPNVIREFLTYRRRKDPKVEDQYLDEVEKRDDDAMDAVRYALFGRFGEPPRIRLAWTGKGFG